MASRRPLARKPRGARRDRQPRLPPHGPGAGTGDPAAGKRPVWRTCREVYGFTRARHLVEGWPVARATEFRGQGAETRGRTPLTVAAARQLDSLKLLSGSSLSHIFGASASLARSLLWEEVRRKYAIGVRSFAGPVSEEVDDRGKERGAPICFPAGGD
jgi:hypothetical protein